MIDQREIELADRAPAATDHVEGPPLGRALEARPGDRVGDLAREATAAPRNPRQLQHAERQRCRAPRLATNHLDKLEAAAAKIAGNAVRLRNPRNHTDPREPPLLFAGKDHWIEAELPYLGKEFLAVRSLAHRRGGDRAGAHHAHLVDQETKAAERRQRALPRRIAQRARLRDVAAQPGHDLFVEDDRGNAAGIRIDDEADRVRSDVDDGDRRGSEHGPL